MKFKILIFAIFYVTFSFSSLLSAQESEKVSPYFAKGVSNSLTSSIVAVAERCAAEAGQIQQQIAVELSKLQQKIKELESQLASAKSTKLKESEKPNVENK